MDDKKTGYISEFDVKKYVRERLLEIKDEDEHRVAKQVLYDGLYRMSEVFEKRFENLFERISEEMESPINEYEIAILLATKGKELFSNLFFAVSDEDITENDSKEHSKADKGLSYERIYLDAPDSVCRDFQDGKKIRISFVSMGEQKIIYAKLKRSNCYIEELVKLHDAFSYNGITWNTVNSVYLERFFDIDLSEVPGDARDIEIDYGAYKSYVKKELYPLWNIEKTVFKSNDFLSPSKDGLYFEHEIPIKEQSLIALRLINAQEGMVGIRQEDRKIIVKTYKESYENVKGYHIFNIRATGEEVPHNLISNRRKYGFLGRYANRSRVVIHTKAEIHKKIEELDISEYVQLKFCQRIDVGGCTDIARKDLIEADMNKFLGGDLLPLDERPTILFGFVRCSQSNLCEAMIRYALSQIQMDFDEYRCVGVIESSYE